MKMSFLDEPKLEFGQAGTHIDPRYGLMENGPLDKDTPSAPTDLKVAIVGTAETIEAMQIWLDKCRNRIEAKPSRLGNLFPPFPGFAKESCFASSIVMDDRWCASVSKRDIDSLLATAPTEEVVESAVELFLQTVRPILDKGGPDVVICAPPQELLTMLDERSSRLRDTIDEELDEGSDTSEPTTRKQEPYFHDVLKARGFRLAVPLQMVRPQTILGRKPKRARGNPRASLAIQDEATRAWNLHAALYYKAGGVPWRILRDSTEMTSCFVGISFFKSLDGERLLTSVAQVFNERGEGVIVKGAPAQIDKSDRTPHLSSYDAYALLAGAVSAYRVEHRTMPARIVIHKTSSMNNEETEGFLRATKDNHIDSVDLLHVRRSLTRLFRESTYPPLRGTFLQLDEVSAILYMRGSVNFFQTYPGMYVPRPLEFRIEQAEATQTQLAREMFALSKLNWNNTQFDGGEPITVRAARRVGDILKCHAEGDPLQPAFRYYM